MRMREELGFGKIEFVTGGVHGMTEKRCHLDFDSATEHEQHEQRVRALSKARLLLL